MLANEEARSALLPVAWPALPDKSVLQSLYMEYNRRELAWPDPVSCIYRFEAVRDREIAALIASSLAFGRVEQIHRSVENALRRTGGRPHEFVLRNAPRAIARAFDGFRHRWVSGDDVSELLVGVSRLLREHGSLESAFSSVFDRADENAMSAAAAFCRALVARCGRPPGRLVPSGAGKCAFKRIHLMLRWMVRRDEIDPGGWESVPASKLVVPLDTHMFRTGKMFGFTARRAADHRAALEITAGFAAVAPDDPVRYDFALTRLGMRMKPFAAEEHFQQAARPLQSPRASKQGDRTPGSGNGKSGRRRDRR